MYTVYMVPKQFLNVSGYSSLDISTKHFGAYITLWCDINDVADELLVVDIIDDGPLFAVKPELLCGEEFWYFIDAEIVSSSSSTTRLFSVIANVSWKLKHAQ